MTHPLPRGSTPTQISYPPRSHPAQIPYMISPSQSRAIRVGNSLPASPRQTNKRQDHAEGPISRIRLPGLPVAFYPSTSPTRNTPRNLALTAGAERY
jgi:hypothetical protein